MYDSLVERDFFTPTNNLVAISYNLAFEQLLWYYMKLLFVRKRNYPYKISSRVMGRLYCYIVCTEMFNS